MSKLVFSLNNALSNLKDSFTSILNEKISQKDIKEINLLFEIL